MFLKNKTVKSVGLYTLIFSVFLASISPLQIQANAQVATSSEEFTVEEERQIEELAAQLEFLMEEALIIENGERTFDFEKIENEFGKEVKDEIKMLTVDAQIWQVQPGAITLAANQPWKDCMVGAIKDHFGVALVTAALEGGLWAYLEKKAYKEAAKLLVKFAVGTNAVGIAGTLIYYGGKCTWKHG